MYTGWSPWFSAAFSPTVGGAGIANTVVLACLVGDGCEVTGASLAVDGEPSSSENSSYKSKTALRVAEGTKWYNHNFGLEFVPPRERLTFGWGCCVMGASVRTFWSRCKHTIYRKINISQTQRDISVARDQLAKQLTTDWSTTTIENVCTTDVLSNFYDNILCVWSWEEWMTRLILWLKPTVTQKWSQWWNLYQKIPFSPV